MVRSLRCPSCGKASAIESVDTLSEVHRRAGVPAPPRNRKGQDRAGDIICPQCGHAALAARWGVTGVSSGYGDVSALVNSSNPHVRAAARDFMRQRGKAATAEQRTQMTTLAKSSVLEVAVAAKRWLREHGLSEASPTVTKAVSAPLNRLATKTNMREALKVAIASLEKRQAQWRRDLARKA